MIKCTNISDDYIFNVGSHCTNRARTFVIYSCRLCLDEEKEVQLEKQVTNIFFNCAKGGLFFSSS